MDLFGQNKIVKITVVTPGCSEKAKIETEIRVFFYHDSSAP